MDNWRTRINRYIRKQHENKRKTIKKPAIITVTPDPSGGNMPKNFRVMGIGYEVDEQLAKMYEQKLLQPEDL